MIKDFIRWRTSFDTTTKEDYSFAVKKKILAEKYSA